MIYKTMYPTRGGTDRTVDALGAPSREATMTEKVVETSQPQVFKYEKPVTDKPKDYVPLSRTDIHSAAIQLVRKGGENNLHSHTHHDGFWFVLSGRARF